MGNTDLDWTYTSKQYQCSHSYLTPLQVLFHEDGSVKGIATADVGIKKDGSPKVVTAKCTS